MSELSIKSGKRVNAREVWREHISKWQEGKLSQQAYCDQAGISYNSFVYWRCQFRASKRSEQKAFMPVKVVSKHQTSRHEQSAIQIQLKSGHIVVLPAALDLREAALLIRLLGN
jgi:hypothetical protein